MDGWTGQILRVNLTNRTHRVETFSEEFATTWIGGRGFAVKILYDELAPGIDPLGPENKLVVAVGPISGIPAPNTGKTIVAAKSPATGGYGDGNLGTRVTDQIRKAGYDALIVEGRADSPDDALHRGRHASSSCPPTRSGARARSRPTTGSTPGTARASASSTSARAARTWSATPPSAASRVGPAAGPAWAPSWAPSSSRPSWSRAPGPSRRRSPRR